MEQNKKKVANLQSRIRQLTEELENAKKQHAQEERDLTGKYELADKGYSEALESYDTDMKDQNKQKDIVQKEYEDAAENLKQVREQWNERLEEKRKRDALQEIIDKKKA